MEGSIADSEDLRDTFLFEGFEWDHKNPNFVNMELTKRIQAKRVNMIFPQKKEDRSKKREKKRNFIEEENNSGKRRNKMGFEWEEGTQNVHYKKLKIV